MNRKVLKTMIALVIIFLSACYVLKIFFPEQFIISVEIKVLIDIGNYIDTHTWSSIIYGMIIGIIFDYLYFGAVCRQKILNWKLIVIILIYNIGFSLFYFLPSPEVVVQYSNIAVAISSCYMIFIPMFFYKHTERIVNHIFSKCYCSIIISKH